MSDSSNELQGWKEIAAYLGRSTRAAQRWEVQHGLPVRRIPGVSGSVFADKTELDAWKRTPRGLTATRLFDTADDGDGSAEDAASSSNGEPPTPAGEVPGALSPPAVAAASKTDSRLSRFSTRRAWLSLFGFGCLVAAAAAVVAAARSDGSIAWLSEVAEAGDSPAVPAIVEDRARQGLDHGAWPADFHDGRQSGQGHTLGPSTPADPKLLVDPGGLLSPADSLIATSPGVVVLGTCDGRLLAVRPDGSLAWESRLDRQHNGETATGLALTHAGQLIVPTGECPHNMYANARTQLHLRRISDGESAFRLRTGAMMIPPALSADGVVYQFDQYNTLRAVDPLGRLEWTLDFPGFTAATPVRMADGTLVVASDGSLFGHRSIWGVSPAGKILWNAFEGLFSRLAADTAGNLYAIDINTDISGRALGPQRLVSFTSRGEQRWVVSFDGWWWSNVRDTMAVGPSGPVVRTGRALVAFTPDGRQRWSAPLAERHPHAPGPILDREENAYFSVANEVVSVDREGRERWRLPVPDAGRIILAGEGQLAVTSANRRVFLVHERGVQPRRHEGPGAI